MEDLLRSYKQTRKELNRSLKAMDKGNETTADREHLAACIRDVEYVIKWIETGWEPAAVRGIQRRSKDQREILVDPFLMQSYAKHSSPGGCRVSVTEEQASMIDMYLSLLSNGEREAYLMIYGGGLSYEKAAELMYLSKGNIQTLIQRAKRKIELFQSLMAISLMVIFYFVVRKPTIYRGVNNLTQVSCVELFFRLAIPRL
ncbi:sigma factor-like helix-turn-helix DNA-binding protein [Brevibacillus sp. JB24b]|uniref:sigma factor-like helix-turn-helix DNA-binding protein n=1 Tax=Brevibacillus sp. JB24b TaxID=3422308 RepID=UPI003F686B3F